MKFEEGHIVGVKLPKPYEEMLNMLEDNGYGFQIITEEFVKKNGDIFVAYHIHIGITPIRDKESEDRIPSLF